MNGGLDKSPLTLSLGDEAFGDELRQRRSHGDPADPKGPTGVVLGGKLVSRLVGSREYRPMQLLVQLVLQRDGAQSVVLRHRRPSRKFRLYGKKIIQMLKRRNFEIIPVASEDMYKHGCNVECIGDGKVVAIEKNKHINDKMRALGLEVIDVPFDQILHAGGGPHCLTQPIERP